MKKFLILLSLTLFSVQGLYADCDGSCGPSGPGGYSPSVSYFSIPLSQFFLVPDGFQGIGFFYQSVMSGAAGSN